MAELKLITTSKSNVDGLAVEDGQVIAVPDGDLLYFDMEGTRHLCTGGQPVTVYESNPAAGPQYATYACNPSGLGAHAEGLGSQAMGEGSHSEGGVGKAVGMPFEYVSKASGQCSHAEGGGTYAEGSYAHSEGQVTNASGTCSHAEGYYTSASGDYAHSEGIGVYESHFGTAPTMQKTTASGTASHAGGQATQATGDYSFSHGKWCEATGEAATALGWYMCNNASGGLSVGYYGTDTKSTDMAFQIGCGEGTQASQRADLMSIRYPKNTNKASSINRGELYGDNLDAYFGTVAVGDTNNNVKLSVGPLAGNTRAFLKGNISQILTDTAWGIQWGAAIPAVMTKDYVFAPKFTTTGLDYAEFIVPWFDSNLDNEDRVGYFVTVKQDGLHKSTSEDMVVGVTSGTYGVLGTGEPHQGWHNRYKTDSLGRYILNDDGDYILTDEFDESSEYIAREDRPEWTPVGLIGQLHVYDDGTCVPGGFCKCNDEGIATAAAFEGSASKWLVLSRVSSNTIKILFK